MDTSSLLQSPVLSVYTTYYKNESTAEHKIVHQFYRHDQSAIVTNLCRQLIPFVIFRKSAELKKYEVPTSGIPLLELRSIFSP